ncbi:2-keto-4-pentenoate hydratase/2-oxohepta-3-ene-1,7-dioic acid hydratase [Caulobacter sp. AP07]|uniref:fumarylacetoacetate hydrolase family protein n=1 Tax=Caulobacter sp. AP07 TaxID=1144304 RepID=UPI0002720C72|nr:fumarylacetoacetate hydrolase family protein [Caulobacter sp. AP07]EJL27359.1 2-keto-4-pentenoate hydratase/2-oxohepta-3-ene-1,7-dioic acid hydratase [Caulobacter sp. AP07]
MKLISFRYRGVASYGAVVGDRVADFGAVAGNPAPDLVGALRLGLIAPLHAAAETHIALNDVELTPVVVNPGKIFCVGANYRAPGEPVAAPAPEYPSIFTRFADTLVGHGGSILLPKVSTRLDYEGELAVVVGKGGRAIAPAEAMDHIAGFTCANDASVRDWQSHTPQFTPGKNFPATCGLGPWLVTPDEIADIATATITTRLNGATMQQGGLSELIFPLPAIIAYLSTFSALSPGDLILTGTPLGVGAKRQPPVWLRSGDLVEVEITGVGLLANTIASEC